METVNTILSLMAIGISIFTLWLTYLHKGMVCMTQPTLIYFGPDGGKHRQSSKIFFRTLLYSTSKRGCVVENLYVRLKRAESQQNFNIWVYGDAPLHRGSGLFVGETGVAVNHHFLLPADIGEYDFKAGRYMLEVYVRLVGNSLSKLLLAVPLEISDSEAKQIKETNRGIYFDWGPDSNQYHTHIDRAAVEEDKWLELIQSSIK